MRDNRELSVKKWLWVIILANLPVINIFYLYKIVFTDEEKPHYRYVRAQATVMYSIMGIVMLIVIFFLAMIWFGC